MSKVAKEKNMQVSIAALRKAIQDYEKYPEFLPEVVGARIVSGKDSQRTEVHFDLNLIKRFQYRLSFNTVSDTEISWKLVESDFFKVNEGRWVLKEAGPKTTHARYELEVGFGFFVPGFIAKTLTETNLPAILDKFEARAKSLEK